MSQIFQNQPSFQSNQFPTFTVVRSLEYQQSGKEAICIPEIIFLLFDLEDNNSTNPQGIPHFVDFLWIEQKKSIFLIRCDHTLFGVRKVYGFQNEQLDLMVYKLFTIWKTAHCNQRYLTKNKTKTSWGWAGPSSGEVRIELYFFSKFCLSRFGSVLMVLFILTILIVRFDYVYSVFFVLV